MSKLYKTNLTISIVIPSYNQGQYIEAAIKSVINQPYQNVELIVVDNLSTDNTLKILNKYKNKITFIREKDFGQTNAINKGYKAATGKIISYLNSDDLLEPKALGHVADYFVHNPKTKIIYGKGKFIDIKGKFLGYYKTQLPTLKSLFKECVISQPTVFMRKELYDEVGTFDESLNYAMDYDYWIRVAKKYRFMFIDETLAVTRLHPKTKTAQKEKVFLEILSVLKKNYGKVSDEAIFNYVYVTNKNAKSRFMSAINKFIAYQQLPSLVGLKHFGILVKQILFKKTS